jgi:flagellar basal body-associated protein FliL
LSEESDVDSQGASMKLLTLVIDTLIVISICGWAIVLVWLVTAALS